MILGLRNEHDAALVNKNISYELDGRIINVNYQRDYYGFRNDSDFKKYNLNDIKIILTGGSTSDELILPYEKTIVGQLNSYFKNKKLNHKIYNASESGKSLRGIFHDFDSHIGFIFHPVSTLWASFLDTLSVSTFS